MELKLLCLGILFMLANVAEIKGSGSTSTVHVINALTDPSPIQLNLAIQRDDHFPRQRLEYLKHDETFDLVIEDIRLYFSCDFKRGEGNGAQFVYELLFDPVRDVAATKLQTNIYWKVDDVGVSISYDNKNYGPKDHWS
ncbi:hypothetical protein AAHA92_11738 [Salvia divinorum]|uniref:S-protein homolog n=1 Tax=Salvia divinorum TaxID=28513 RepID=A0ABD1HI10_SALDI